MFSWITTSNRAQQLFSTQKFINSISKKLLFQLHQRAILQWIQHNFCRKKKHIFRCLILFSIIILNKNGLLANNVVLKMEERLLFENIHSSLLMVCLNEIQIEISMHSCFCCIYQFKSFLFRDLNIWFVSIELIFFFQISTENNANGIGGLLK